MLRILHLSSPFSIMSEPKSLDFSLKKKLCNSENFHRKFSANFDWIVLRALSVDSFFPKASITFVSWSFSMLFFWGFLFVAAYPLRSDSTSTTGSYKPPFWTISTWWNRGFTNSQEVIRVLSRASQGFLSTKSWFLDHSDTIRELEIYGLDENLGAKMWFLSENRICRAARFIWKGRQVIEKHYPCGKVVRTVLLITQWPKLTIWNFYFCLSTSVFSCERSTKSCDPKPILSKT